MNGLVISKSTFNRITKHNLKWHLNKMHVRKERNNYKWKIFSKIKSRFTLNNSGRNIKTASISSKRFRTRRRKQKLAAYIRNTNMLCFFLLPFLKENQDLLKRFMAGMWKMMSTNKCRTFRRERKLAA